MLSQLLIEDFAIIDHLTLDFDSGFTVVTGETGAGKSIIIDALQAALGARVAADAVRSGARLASIEAVFDLESEETQTQLAATLSELGIDLDGQLILRREINASGRGTARVNGRAVPLAVLASVGADLVDIHGQSDHLSVLRRDRQRDALDAFGRLGDTRREVGAALAQYEAVRRELIELEAGRREAERRLDLLRFQVTEIESAELAAGEEETLLAERSRLANVGRLSELSHAAHDALSGSAMESLVEAVGRLQDLKSIDPSLAALAERAASAQLDLEDIAQEVRRYSQWIEYDPVRLSAVETRLDLIKRLQRKYGTTVSEILAFGAGARRDMEDIENLDDRLDDARRRSIEAEAQAGALADSLSQQRARAAEQLTVDLSEALRGLGLKNTEFRCDLSSTPSDDGILLPSSGRRVAYGPAGVDTVTFLVSFNPGEPLRPLDRVASGGETSRFLLALKSVLAGADRTPTLVFDEVDVGIGGRHGMVVGERLRALAATHQVISITHLPQVAALGDQHLTVSKAERNGRTSVAVRSLDAPGRIGEIAEMMSGTGTETARKNAAELIETARRGRNSD